PRRPRATLDLGPELWTQPEQEPTLGDDEQRADEQPDEVVQEGRLASLEAVTDELHHPADEEEPETGTEPHRPRACPQRPAPPHRDAGPAAGPAHPPQHRAVRRTIATPSARSSSRS